ncbi:DNA-binding protein WhiA [Tuanshanicoccus lijuaniae]|uniref:DNA-binding protein WhiA n=1 Tax=Aerococcaceae bacterium zg-1292 TaxID=2774330 RepID=UPI001937F5E4|nr:DNA-binding protein WhiA [Aerococcaceae bacterium zg-1292]MBF6626818.1 DNA-binding protein WhiA [Aerococcaceae bacterium zg-BR9]MBF6979268.1 DNA-binding protein WhiA [Aerococcaceae bacterium zg-BR22]MBS4456914.1 DNA-binding protein WhiA [Aerococcaceae bacterium zg-A91]MBS4458876.1 DNA-binding protein WhiA [Aerococcaceae bacterium zg-BR33]
MTFAAEVKKECTLIEVHREHAKAELTALIRMNGAVSIYQQALILNIQSENAAIARRIYTLFKEHFSLDSELIVRRKMKLKKNNVYIVRCRQNVKEVLEALDIFDGMFIRAEVSDEIMHNNQKKRSYLRGAFMAAGSVNNPEANSYHLEIYSNYESHNENICQMMNDFNLHARTIARRNGYITYIKEAEKIADFLAVIGANSAVLKFEDIRIVRDMRNSVNRLVNCENANLNKVVEAANRQREAIEKIQQKKGLDSLPEKLRTMAQFRLDNPDMGLKELGELIPGGPISKSGVNHRLRKLLQIANELE